MPWTRNDAQRQQHLPAGEEEEGHRGAGRLGQQAGREDAHRKHRARDQASRPGYTAAQVVGSEQQIER